MDKAKILFIGGQPITGKAQTGGVQCSLRNYRLLCRIFKDDKLHAIIPTSDKEEYIDSVTFYRELQNLRERCIAALFLCKAYMPWDERNILSAIKKFNPDMIFLDSSMMGGLLSYRKICGRAKIVVFFHNVERDYAWNKVKNEGIQYLPAFLASTFNEKCAIKHADKIICLNYRDEKRLNELYGVNADLLLPISFQDDFKHEKLARNIGDKTLLFIGSCFAPNYHGIKWFVENVMPDIPEYRLVIVGKGFEERKNELERENVSVIGTVDDLSEYYYHASAMAMPILYGEGMKVKTAEAMMYGMTIFATDEALEGYDVEGIEGIYRCNSKDDFIQSIRSYYEVNSGETYNMGVRERFLDKYEMNRQIENTKALFDEMG